jgi:5-methylcytosine-specific restriction endonuclease McrA
MPERGGGSKKFDGRSHITDLYGKKWNTYRYRYLHHNPHCYACGKKSEVIDHVKPHRGDETLFWKTDNMIPLCHRCHNTITGLFDKPGKAVDEKLKWLANTRAKNEITTKVKITPLGDD